MYQPGFPMGKCRSDDKSLPMLYLTSHGQFCLFLLMSALGLLYTSILLILLIRQKIAFLKREKNASKKKL